MPDIFISPSSQPKSNTPLNVVSKPTTPPSVSKRKSTFSLFSASSYMPEHMKFETQGEGEMVILLLRRHFITNIPWVVLGIVLLITPFYIFPAISVLGIIPSSFPNSFIMFSILVWYTFTLGFLLAQYLSWYFNVSIVTNERIVDIDLTNLLYKTISETRISKIEDVSSHTGGFIRAVFDYGDVDVQTAGSSPNFEFLAVPDPENVVRVINQLMGKEE